MFEGVIYKSTIGQITQCEEKSCCQHKQQEAKKQKKSILMSMWAWNTMVSGHTWPYAQMHKQ